ncbi:hypothetical protein C8R46DRAFT_533993 [Mycena filopes]|nr:hypothetical protein C8R46DRAFT_533993 [Mycena filopes]
MYPRGSARRLPGASPRPSLEHTGHASRVVRVVRVATGLRFLYCLAIFLPLCHFVTPVKVPSPRVAHSHSNPIETADRESPSRREPSSRDERNLQTANGKTGGINYSRLLLSLAPVPSVLLHHPYGQARSTESEALTLAPIYSSELAWAKWV